MMVRVHPVAPLLSGSVPFKCALLSTGERAGQKGLQFRFFTWTIAANNKCGGGRKDWQPSSLLDRLKVVYPDEQDYMPNDIIYIDENKDSILIPIDDVRETLEALNFIRSPNQKKPVRIFVQLNKPPGEDQLVEQDEEGEKEKTDDEPPKVEEVIVTGKSTFFEVCRCKLEKMEGKVNAVVDSIPSFIGRIKFHHFLLILLALFITYLFVQYMLVQIAHHPQARGSQAANYILNYTSKAFNIVRHFICL